MKSAITATAILAAILLCSTVLRGKEAKSVAYDPAVVTLVGTIVEEGYGDDPSPIDRGKRAWILHLDRPISVAANPSDKIDVEEENVTEVHLNVDHAKHPIPKASLGKTRYTATGTLYHAHTVHHLRPIVMLVSVLKAAPSKARRD
jgi:hypothetical protein